MKIRKSIKHYYYTLIGLDVLMCIFSFCISYWLKYYQDFPSISPNYVAIFPYVITVWILSMSYFSLYRERFGLGMEFIQIMKAGAVSVGILIILSFFYQEITYSRRMAVVFIILVSLSCFTSRQMFRLILTSVLTVSRWQKMLLIIGCGDSGKKLIDELNSNTTEFQVIGFLDDDDDLQHSYYHSVPCQGKLPDLDIFLQRNDIDEVIIAVPSASTQVYKTVIETCDQHDVPYRFVPKLFNIMLQDVTFDVLADIPLVGIKGNNLTGLNYILKRIFDFMVSLVLILIFSPLMAGVAISIKLVSKGPVFYIQERIGYKKRPFKFIKFRSMRPDTDDKIHREYTEKWIKNDKQAELMDGETTVHKLTDDPRVIPVIGNFIRKFSIDELPQLFNVLKGDMSLVGPRPCLNYELEQYKHWHKARFDILPGITGLWQVSGRNRLTFDEMVRLDISYLQNWHFEKDLFILLKTPFIVLFDKAY